MVFRIISGIIAFMLITAEGADVAKYACVGTTIKITEIVIDSLPNNKDPAVIYAKGKKDTCSSIVTNAAAAADVQMSGDGKATGYAGEIPDSKADKCGVVKNAGPPATRTVTFIVGRDTDAVFKDDKLIPFTCTDGVTSTGTATIGTVTGEPDAPVTVTNDVNSVGKVVANNDNTNTAKTNAAIGDQVQLYIETTGGSLIATKMVTCIGGSSAAFAAGDKTAAVISNGCSDDADGVFPDKTGKPTYGTTAGPPQANTAKSPAFGIFKFYGVDGTYFKCDVLGCLTGDNTCTNYNCPPGNRKRREAPSRNRTMTQAKTFVFVVDRMTNTQTKEKQEAAFANCLNHVSFIAIVAILALLLLISLAVSVFFCSKLLRQKEKGSGLDGYPNRAYKA